MCLIVFGHRVVPGYELVLLGNRDEFLDRPASRLGWWDDEPGILAGRDLQAGGTWMGVHQSGRWSALTNYREPGGMDANARSRGELPVFFMKENLTVLSGLSRVASRMEEYNGFNLLVGDGRELGYLSNRASEAPRLLEPGYYGLSNHLLNTPWPKVTRTLERFRDITQEGRVEEEPLLGIMRDTATAPDRELPTTGVPLEWERALSAPFIHLENKGYGTRLTTLLTISDEGQIRMVEWGRSGEEPVRRFEFSRGENPQSNH